MHVVATAGHVDHGKSTLVRALTGTDPDRLPEEHRRGLTIELGYCWTTIPAVGEVAFVDVPGHERFVPTMLAGVGPVPAALFVVAADAPWMPQAAEHLAALDALDVRHAVVAVTRSDLADPGPAMARTRRELAGTSLAGARIVAVSGRTGAGLPELRAALSALLAALPVPDPDADVRLWVDRRFQVTGAGTVVTGTLPAGTVRVGDELAAAGTVVRVRGLQTLTTPVPRISGVARVALNLAGPVPKDFGRGDALLTPGAWEHSDCLDVRLADGTPPPVRLHLHVGAAATPVRTRPLGDRHARLTLARPLPLRPGDRVLLRDPGSHLLWGALVLDPAPPTLERRGAAAARARLLSGVAPAPDLADELRRRGLARASWLRRLGVPSGDLAAHRPRAGDWLLDPTHATNLARSLTEQVASYCAARPLERGMPVAAAAHALGLPDERLVATLAALLRPPLELAAGTVRVGGAVLPDWLSDALAALGHDFAGNPFAAPDANRLRELRLDTRALAAAERAGEVWRVADGIVLPRIAESVALQRLSALPQPFTASEARTALQTTRRVVLPLLDHLDRSGATRRLPDDRRCVVHRGTAPRRPDADPGNRS